MCWAATRFTPRSLQRCAEAFRGGLPVVDSSVLAISAGAGSLCRRLAGQQRCASGIAPPRGLSPLLPSQLLGLCQFRPQLRDPATYQHRPPCSALLALWLVGPRGEGERAHAVTCCTEQCCCLAPPAALSGGCPLPCSCGGSLGLIDALCCNCNPLRIRVLPLSPCGGVSLGQQWERDEGTIPFAFATNLWPQAGCRLRQRSPTWLVAYVCLFVVKEWMSGCVSGRTPLLLLLLSQCCRAL